MAYRQECNYCTTTTSIVKHDFFLLRAKLLLYSGEGQKNTPIFGKFVSHHPFGYVAHPH